ncbi:MAG: hypothetical protein JRH10_02085 [Deltaproteobacteria bacterium]|nr:hypothetical protein [Deltaproteobacteria bacterium]MBW2445449.1 hypothetical protein [Deltaproteobacteria bacterium]
MAEQPPIERAFFREDEDGIPVFFPWGMTHRGYRLTEDGAREKAARAGSLLIGATVVVGTWTAYALQPLLEPGAEAAGLSEILGAVAGPLAVLALALFGYAWWASRFVERFLESSLVVSREERLREAAEFASPWKIATIGLILAGTSAILIKIQPGAWWIGLLGVALGLGILVWSSVLRRAATSPGD